MKKWFESLHAWGLQVTNAKWGPWILCLFGIADASFLPLPVTTLFLALSLLNSKKRLTYLIFLTLGISAGATIGYLTGRFAWLDQKSDFTGLAHFFINNIPGFSAGAYQKIHMLYSKWGSWILLGATTTPLPYGLFSISSGVFNINIFIFVFITMLSHGLKYFILAFLSGKMGPTVGRFIEFSLRPVAIIPAVCVVVAIIVFKVI